jgi:glycosyltransferase involved in cell wall biosynthesis
VLTGTDLYEDLPGSAEAARSLDDAGTIVVLQQDALVRLDERWRGKARVIFQSAKGLRARRKAADRLDCVAVGHLRAEKDPLTVIAAMRLVPRGLPIRLRHIGAPLDPALAQAARAFAREDYRYTYAGALPHGLARAAMRSAHFLVHASVVEGGANVIAEAVTGGTAVIASRISGNLGMLGRSYPGFFEARDASGLARCLVQALEDPRYRSSLERACKARKALFAPAAEQSALRDLARDLLA